ncbi:MAG: MBL fold metallo-hydrolase [Clostridia bacterium]|nr:MBL fold metallo-hydrolase [Clostridia bacterium]
MRIKVLGTQSPYVTENHNCPGFLIESGQHRIMLDCGSGTHRMLDFPNDLNNLHVFLTHLHRDHYNDIFNIQYASYVFHNQKRLENPVEIYLPMSPQRIYGDIISESNSYTKYHKIKSNTKVHIGELEITFLLVEHAVETYAVKVTDGRNTIVYTSDVSFISREQLVDFAKYANVLISESSLLKEHGFPKINSHLTAHQAATIAKEAEVGKLVLTHFWPEEDVNKYLSEAKEIFEDVEVAIEGMILM